jgi:hypothetical protein
MRLYFTPWSTLILPGVKLNLIKFLMYLLRQSQHYGVFRRHRVHTEPCTPIATAYRDERRNVVLVRSGEITTVSVVNSESPGNRVFVPVSDTGDTTVFVPK